jgi:hypothetical protein
MVECQDCTSCPAWCHGRRSGRVVRRSVLRAVFLDADRQGRCHGGADDDCGRACARHVALHRLSLAAGQDRAKANYAARVLIGGNHLRADVSAQHFFLRPSPIMPIRHWRKRSLPHRLRLSPTHANARHLANRANAKRKGASLGGSKAPWGIEVLPRGRWGTSRFAGRGSGDQSLNA